MIVEKNKSLAAFNTMNIDVNAAFFYECTNANEIISFCKESNSYPLVIGGGSNMVLMENINRPTLHINTKGIKVVKQTDDVVWVESKAGESWHDLVMYALENNYGGIENLSLIPGSVGASPIQNIGAYGVEIKDTFVYLEAIEFGTGKKVRFNKDSCEFGYRDSVFKNRRKNQYIISSVVFELTKHNHQLKTDYGAIQTELTKLGVECPTIQDVSQAVINIRRSKLPDPVITPNCGSFFKNPIITKSLFNTLIERFPLIPNYPISIDKVKIPAGWLIDTLGWKGRKVGNVGVHKNQALVLVNFGNGTGKEIYNLSEQIIADVKSTFGIKLEREVNIIPSPDNEITI